MNINPVEDRFLDYLEGRLNEADRGKFEKALNESAELQRMLQEFVAISNLGDAVSKQEFKLGADFAVRLMERIEDQKDKTALGINPIAIWIRRLMAPVAACATVAIAVLLSTRGYEASRPESMIPELAVQHAAGGGEAAAGKTIDKALSRSTDDKRLPEQQAASVEGAVKQAAPKEAAQSEKDLTLNELQKRSEKLAQSEISQSSTPEAATPQAPPKVGAGTAYSDLRLKEDLGAAKPELKAEKPITRPLDAPSGVAAAKEEMSDLLSAGNVSAGASAKTPSKGRINYGNKNGAERELEIGGDESDLTSETAASSAPGAKMAGARPNNIQTEDFLNHDPTLVNRAQRTDGRKKAVESAVRVRKDFDNLNAKAKKTVADLSGFGSGGPASPDQFGSYQPAPPAETNSEVYSEFEENLPVLVSEQPVSTFSLDVDTGSYTNVRRFLSMGALPPKNSVRIEEFINYFDYSYDGAGVAPQEGAGPFGVYFEAGPSPLEPDRILLKVGVKTKHIVQNDDQPWNMVFLVDTSGSMADEDKLPLLKRSLKLLVNKMRPMDRIGIVTYSDTARASLPITSGENKVQIEQVIDGLSAAGGTNGADGIDKAYQLAEQGRVKGGVNRVILATDGDFNVGNYSFDGLMNLVSKMKATGISLTTVGFGAGNYNEKNMEQLADRGDGNYFYVDSFNEARRIFSDEIAKMVDVVAKDVKLQIEFNPDQVVAYRLIGYDNRKLKNEDFQNDSVDAGEVGGEQTVTALYELVMKGSPLAQKIKTDLRYQVKELDQIGTVPADVRNELGFLKIRYKEPAAPVATPSKLIQFPVLRELLKTSVEQTSEDFRFASAVAYFAQILRQSRFVGDYKTADVVKLAQSAKGADTSGKREEFIGLMKNVSVLNSH